MPETFDGEQFCVDAGVVHCGAGPLQPQAQLDGSVKFVRAEWHTRRPNHSLCYCGQMHILRGDARVKSDA